MTREEYEIKKTKSVEDMIFCLMDKTCNNCLFYSNEACYKKKDIKHDINQCEFWENEGYQE